MARKLAWAPVAIGLLLGACGRPEAAPTPVPVPSTTLSQTSVQVPPNASISVRPAPTTTTTVAATTEPPPPPPVQPPVQVQPQPTQVEPTQPPLREVALLGFPCQTEGEEATDPAGRPLVCEKSRRGRLFWAKP